MELSKEEIKLLKLAKTNKIPLTQESLYDNKILGKLLYDKKLINFKPRVEEDGNYTPLKFWLEPDGEIELSKALQARSDFWKAHLYLPIIASTFTGVITYFVGYLVGQSGH